MQEFIEAECIRAAGAKVTGSELYRAYLKWAEAQGLPAPHRLSRRACCLALVRQGFRTAKVSGGVRVWCGLRVRAGTEDTPLGHALCHS